MNFIMHMYRLW